MRYGIGLVGILGIGLAAGLAMAQAPAPRGVRPLPPRRVEADEGPSVARGVSDELPSATASTPVSRPPAAPATRPNWLSGTDTGVRPAAHTGLGRPTLPAGGIDTTNVPAPQTEPAAGGGGGDRGKWGLNLPGLIAPGGGRGATARTKEPGGPPAAFRGTTADGATVYAGPPAYRWYGWGSVTPGANPYAPSGRYPQASATWYAITGATPGAFPVPVTLPPGVPAGPEPPAYVPVSAAAGPAGPPSAGRSSESSAAMRPSAGLVPPPVVRPTPPLVPPDKVPGSTPRPLVTPRNEPIGSSPPPAHKPELILPAPVLLRPPGVGVGPVPVPPTISGGASPSVIGPLSVSAAPVSVPVGPPPASVPLTGPETTAGSPAPPAVPKLLPVVSPVVPARSDPSQLPVRPPTDPAPADVPVSRPVPVPASDPPTDPFTPAGSPPPPSSADEVRWQRGRSLPDGEWNRAGARTPPAGPNAAPAGDDPLVRPASGASAGPPPSPDVAAALIHRLCDGLATGVEVRAAGEHKLTVCLECATEADAQGLVRRISGRPELAAYHIDFCVLVK